MCEVEDELLAFFDEGCTRVIPMLSIGGGAYTPRCGKLKCTFGHKMIGGAVQRVVWRDGENRWVACKLPDS